MRYIKPILFGLSGLFIVITLISLMMPSRITLVSNVLIQADSGTIMTQIENPANWGNWHPFLKANCTSVISSSGEFSCLVEGEKYAIRRIPDTSGLVHLVMMTTDNPDMHYRFFMNSPSETNGIDLHWQVQTTLRWYPWEKFSGIFFTQTAGPGYDLALQALKQYCENKKALP